MGYVSVFRAKLQDTALVAYGEALEEYFTAVEEGDGALIAQRRLAVQQATEALHYYS